MAQPVPVPDNKAYQYYLYYSSILVLKMMFMSLLTAFFRFKTKSFANPEDAAGLKLPVRVHERVERVRRAHLNDLENITLFFVSGYIYTLTNPDPTRANLLFLTYTLARIAHTIVYAMIVVPQPARGLSWGIGYLITGYMALRGVFHFVVY